MDMGRVKARADVIEEGLGGWITANTSSKDGAALCVALLRMAVNQHISMLGEPQAMEHLADLFDEQTGRGS